MKKLILPLSVLFAIYSCNQKQETSKPDVVAQNMDTSFSPSDDFFMYANGGWIKNNPIPEEQSSWGIGNLVMEENMKRLREICEKSASSPAKKGSSEQQIGDFWTTGMDSIAVEKSGLAPLKPWLDKISAIKDISSLIQVSAELKKRGSSTFFSEYVSQDAKNSEVMAFQLYQGGIGLPEREYYFKEDSATIDIRNAYLAYMTKILTMSGENESDAATAAKNILALETRLANASRKLEDLRDPYKNYNKMAVNDLAKMSAAIPWSVYLPAIGYNRSDSVIVGQPEFFKELGNLLNTVPLSDWKAYVKFNLISDMAAVLPEAYGVASFEFNKLFSGAKVRKPRWKRVIQLQESVMGEMMGKLYVNEFFNETAKKRYSVMVDAIKDALKERIGKLDWMSDSTKEKAYVKLTSIKSKVGYPDKWKDLSTMNISRNGFAENLMNARVWWHDYEYAKLGKPVDRDEWDMYPQTYNAYYNPSNNEIVLPAGIFTVPGYRDEELDDAVVYGYAGASTIGHEITHGFDDEGRQFDAKGNLVSWWTSADEEKFKQKADVMVKQFDAYEPVKGYHINGKATLGENIADLGGILLGIEAFKKTQQYKENKPIAGILPMQRYYLGYALGWLGHTREEQEKNRLMTDVHSPAKYRVNGPFADVDDFYSTFNVKPGANMYRADSVRVHIW